MKVPLLILDDFGLQSLNESQHLGDEHGREIDVHAFIFDEQGNVVEGIMYPAASLTGTGTINGHTVRCISPKYMVGFLAPLIHKWPDKHLQAVSELCEKFEIDLPKEYFNYGIFFIFVDLCIDRCHSIVWTAFSS